MLDHRDSYLKIEIKCLHSLLDKMPASESLPIVQHFEEDAGKAQRTVAYITYHAWATNLNEQIAFS